MNNKTIMKQTVNISLLVTVLSIPFALSQTRKAIPAGRFEALSGVKTSHSVKSAESALTKDSLGLFWTEVAKHIPQGRAENSFFSAGTTDPNFKTFLSSKGVVESKKFDSKVNILLSDNLSRDSELYKKVKIKGSLVILKDKHSLKEVLAALPQYDVEVYQAENEENYFLLKLK
ncbi:MAG: hypothetical protein ACXVLQ_05600 [Bacteriovorax sp.]